MDRIRGIVPPMITPLLDEDTLDKKGIENLVEYLVSGGVHGLFLLGTTGEGPSLNKSLRIELIKKVCDQVNSRIPVLVGIMETSYKESINLANKAKDLGADAVVLAPPCFFLINQDELYHYVDQMLDNIPLPLYLYNNPKLTKVSFELRTVRKLLSNNQVRGIKDSSSDMIYFQKLRKYTLESDTDLFMGPEELLMESLIMGGDGGIPGGANIYPELYVNMYSSVQTGDLDRAHDLQREILKLCGIVFSGNGYGASKVISGIKNTLKYLDICNDYIAKPLNNISREKSKKIEQWINTKLKTKLGN